MALLRKLPPFTRNSRGRTGIFTGSKGNRRMLERNLHPRPIVSPVDRGTATGTNEGNTEVCSAVLEMINIIITGSVGFPSSHTIQTIVMSQGWRTVIGIDPNEWIGDFFVRVDKMVLSKGFMSYLGTNGIDLRTFLKTAEPASTNADPALTFPVKSKVRLNVP